MAALKRLSGGALRTRTRPHHHQAAAHHQPFSTSTQKKKGSVRGGDPPDPPFASGGLAGAEPSPSAERSAREQKEGGGVRGDRRQPKQAVAAYTGYRWPGASRASSVLKGQAEASFRCRSSILVQSALEQPVLLDGASWSCTRPSVALEERGHRMARSIYALRRLPSGAMINGQLGPCP